MRLLLICRASAAAPTPRAVNAADFDLLCERENTGEITPITEKAPALLGRPVYIGPEPTSRQTAEALFPEAEPVTEAGLAELPCRSFTDTARRFPLWLWRFMAWLQRLLDLPRQGERRNERIARADALLDKLEARGGDAVLIVPPRLIPLLLDRARQRGFCAQRSGVLRYRPLERILVSRREEHCGGCQHNCLLDNPGCDIGRDKARRRSH